MRVCILGNDAYYTGQWLASAANRHGVHPVAEDDNPECFWVTVSDVEDLKTLRQAKKKAAGRPVVAGGLCAMSGNGLALSYADAVVVGEGEEFIAACGSGGLGAAMSLPCVVTKADPWKAAVPATKLDFNTSPVVQVTNHCWYALAARGCPQHCNFCMTSWATKHQRANDKRLEAIGAAVRAQDPRAQVTYITNYSRGLPGRKRGAQSFLLKEYLANPSEADGLTLVRLGVEGMSEARREWLGKPITDEELRAAIALAKDRHQQLELFFIVGFPGSNDEWRELCDVALPVEDKKGCHLWVKYTYFNACPLTPLSRYDVTQLEQFDTPTAFRLAMARTQRYHDHRIQGMTKALWRTVLHRALWRDAEAVPATPPKCAPDAFIVEMQRRGLGYTLAPGEGDVLPGEQVAMWNAKAREARAEQCKIGH